MGQGKLRYQHLGVSCGFLISGLFLAACGDTKTLSLQYSDNISAAPQFLVSVQSDDSSHFSQNQAAGRNPSTNELVYYYGSETKYLKNCAVATSQVDLNSSYHVGTPALSDCTNYASALRTEELFPIPAADIKVGPDLGLGEDGYIYALFFYNPTNTSTGTTANPGEVISSSRRCVKIWAARIQNKKLIQNGGVESSGSINLASLTCFGF